MASRLKPRATPRRRRRRQGSGIFSEFEHGVEQAGVAEPRREHGAARRRRRLHGEREHFRVGRLGVAAAEALKPGLRLLAALGSAGAKNRAEIGIFGDAAGLVRGEISAADGDRIFGPQAQLLARGVGGEEQAAADLLARHVEKDRRRVQDRRLGPLEAGGEKAIERALAGGARRLMRSVATLRRLARRIGKDRSGISWGHRMALISLWAPFNKAGAGAQPLTLPKVNALQRRAPGCRRGPAMVG